MCRKEKGVSPWSDTDVFWRVMEKVIAVENRMKNGGGLFVFLPEARI